MYSQPTLGNVRIKFVKVMFVFCLLTQELIWDR